MVQAGRDILIQDAVERLGLAEVRENRVNELKGLVDLLADFGTGEDDLSRHEDEQHNLGLHHTVDETGEEFGLRHVSFNVKVSMKCATALPRSWRTCDGGWQDPQDELGT